MGELKTKKTNASVPAFVKDIVDEQQRHDARALLQLMGDVTGEKPKLWGTNIVGFGSYHYKYASGREGDWFRVGFSPRKQSLTLYVMDGFSDYAALLARLGKHKTGKSCLYVKRLSDVDTGVLRAIIERSCANIADRYGA